MDFDQAVEEIFESAHNMKEIRIIKEQISAGKEIVIFGAGNCGHAVWRFLSAQGIKIEAFCDNRLAGSIDEETSLPIIGVGEMETDRKRYFILISVADKPIYEIIYHQLMQVGFQDSQCLFMEDYVETIPIDFLIKYRHQYHRVFNMLDDEISRKVYIERIKRVYILSDISDVMQPEEEQYFDKIVKLTEREVFIDCGAYIGDTAAEFIKRTNGKYRQIYMFEAEESKYGQIMNSMKGYKYILYPFGVWSENAKLRFDAGGGSASKVLAADTQGEEIEAVALDGIEFDAPPTLIKMDIEGFEKQALLGASDLISKHTPKLAVCVYHKPEDLFELPLLIKEINPKYSLYMRHYSDHFAETVCYAI